MSERDDIPATDEELVEMHKKARKRKRTRRILTVVIVVAAVIIVLAVVIVMLRNRVTESVGSSTDEVVSATVQVGSVTTTVSGSGLLSDEELDDLTVPESIEVTAFYVEEGDSVEEGDLIATVTSASLMNAMSDTQAAIDALDEKIQEAAGDTVASTISSSVSGRVKQIYVSDGEDVAAVMYRDGALMLLSLDGYMAVDIAADDLSANDSVTVTGSDGTAYDGTVESAAGGIATILLTDDGPLYGDTVTVETTGGSGIGSGTLYIHSPMAITGYTGNVSTVEVSLDSEVSAGTTLITLTDTETSANYDTLLVERRELEDQLDALIRIYKEGGICSPGAGTIDSINETLTGTASASASSSLSSVYGDYLGSMSTDTASADTGEVTVATVSLNQNMVLTINVDESDILALSLGQDVSVTVDSIGDETFEGTVTSINTTASAASGVTTYTAEITIPRTDEMLSGMSASAKITIEGVDNALIIPAEALHQTSSTAYVYTQYDQDTGEFSGMTEVTAGLSNGTYVEITGGLSEGDVVWYTPSGDDWYSMLNGSGFDINSFDIDSFDMDNMPSGGIFGGDMPSDAGGMGGGMGGGLGGMGGGMGGR